MKTTTTSSKGTTWGEIKADQRKLRATAARRKADRLQQAATDYATSTAAMLGITDERMVTALLNAFLAGRANGEV